MKQNLLVLSALLLLTTLFALTGCEKEENSAPQISSISANPDTLFVDSLTTLTCESSDPDGDNLFYLWHSVFGSFPDGRDAKTVQWLAPSEPGNYSLTIMVADDNDTVEDSVNVTVIPQLLSNYPPSTPRNPDPFNHAENVSTSTALSWFCSDPDGDPLTYDLYFGSDTLTAMTVFDLNESSYEPATLEANTQYFWRVGAKDDHENETGGSHWWSFTTEDNNTLEPGTEQEFELGDTGLMTTMVWIPAGTFMMGALPNESGAMGDEYPRYEVTMSEGFWMGKYELTQNEWETVVGNWSFNFDSNPNRPAEMISWSDINSLFLGSINDAESGSPWRMPSEAEWEYACRAGHDDTRFWWGDDIGYNEIDDYAWHWGNNDTCNGHETHDVGQKLPNPWGLYDMSGNVWEWCRDHYHFDYNGAPTDGSAWIGQGGNGRVARGGGWSDYGAPFCRSAARGRDSEANGYPIFGFRLVRDAD
jgi:formylglycine-generating enzyme required for sulfatase activity